MAKKGVKKKKPVASKKKKRGTREITDLTVEPDGCSERDVLVLDDGGDGKGVGESSSNLVGVKRKRTGVKVRVGGKVQVINSDDGAREKSKGVATAGKGNSELDEDDCAVAEDDDDAGDANAEKENEDGEGAEKGFNLVEEVKELPWDFAWDRRNDEEGTDAESGDDAWDEDMIPDPLSSDDDEEDPRQRETTDPEVCADESGTDLVCELDYQKYLAKFCDKEDNVDNEAASDRSKGKAVENKKSGVTRNAVSGVSRRLKKIENGRADHKSNSRTVLRIEETKQKKGDARNGRKIAPTKKTNESKTRKKKEDVRRGRKSSAIKKEKEERSVKRNAKSQTILRASKRLKTENGKPDYNLVNTKTTQGKKRKIPVTKKKVASKSKSHVKEESVYKFKACKKENEKSMSTIDKSYAYYIQFLRNSLTIFQPEQKEKPVKDSVALTDPDIIAISNHPFPDGGNFPFEANKDEKIILLMDDNGCSKASDLSLEELMDENSSQPPQIAEWLWCIEYVAKFVKDIRCIHDLMNMGYQYSNDYGWRINEVLALRVLEFMFNPSKNDAQVSSTSEARVEFNLSSSNTDVLRAILKEIPVSELRAGMPELSKFNVLPFIAHKNMCLPQCALEKLRDVSLLENETSAVPSMEANDPVFRDDRSVHMDTCEEEAVAEQQVHIGSEQNVYEEDKVVVIEDADEPMHTNERDELVMIDDNTETTVELINDDYTTAETFSPSSRRCPWPEDARVKCTRDGTWLISGSDDDESDIDHMVKGPLLATANTNTYTNLLHSSSRTKPENVCWKCEKEGTLLVCSRSECAAKVHKECLCCPVDVDEDGNFLCPLCCYDRVAMEYFESQKLMSSAKKRLVKFFPLLSTRIKRLRC